MKALPEPGEFVTLKCVVSDMTPRGQVPWFREIRSLQPDGFIEESASVILAEWGKRFVKCICKAGVVYFRVENIQL